MSDAELQAQIDAFRRCIEQRDRDLANTVLADDYALVVTHPAPALMPRERWLEVLPDYVVDTYDVQDQRIDLSGDCACVLQRVAMQATVLGEDRSGLFVITDVWLRAPGG